MGGWYASADLDNLFHHHAQILFGDDLFGLYAIHKGGLIMFGINDIERWTWTQLILFVIAPWIIALALH